MDVSRYIECISPEELRGKLGYSFYSTFENLEPRFGGNGDRRPLMVPGVPGTEVEGYIETTEQWADSEYVTYVLS